MSELSVPLADIAEAGLDFETRVAVEAFQPPGAEPLSLDCVHVCGMFVRVSEDVLFRGVLRGILVHACDRCLAETSTPLAVDVVWTFEEGPDPSAAECAEDSGLRAFRGTEVDLAPCVWEELVLAVPPKHLCRKDCAGLCPGCGANLNEGPCGCEGPPETPADGRRSLAGLGDLFPELMNEKSKE